MSTTAGFSMAYTTSSAYCDGAKTELTPLGQRRRKLPLQRKVKQLERPWQDANAGGQLVAPHCLNWASSQQPNMDGRNASQRPRSSAPATRRSGLGGMSNNVSASCGTLKRCGIASRSRPSTGSSPSLSSLRRPAWSRQEPDRVNVTGIKGAVDVAVEPDESINFICGCRYRLGPDGGGGGAEVVGNKQSVKMFTDATSNSDICSPSPLVTSSVLTSGGAVNTGGGGEIDGKNIAWRLVGTPIGNSEQNDDEEDSYNSKSSLYLGSAKYSTPTPTVIGDDDAGGGAKEAARRPNSAGVSMVQDSSVHTLAREKDENVRPRTAGSSQGRTFDPSFASGESSSSERSGTPAETRQILEKGEFNVTGWGDESPLTGPSVECQQSLFVVLPTLGEGNDTRDSRFRPGSAKQASARGALESSEGENLPVDILDIELTADDIFQRGLPGGSSNSSEAKSKQNASNILNYGRGNYSSGGNPSLAPPVRDISTHIDTQGYLIQDSKRQVAPYVAALHGRALYGSHRPRSPSCKRPLPLPPAVRPGEQQFGAAHPLSPTSMGSPPRRHRNSNWGEESARLSVEEEKNARLTVPFIVSGTLLGWKLSTRERKKSLEDSLKTCDYSEHHLIPVYGFRCNINENENEAEGAERGGGGRMVSVEERRMELRRLQARALAAERASTERRSRAEGGARGAAFARATSRRALARAEWIQKMGDVHDTRREKVCRGSSPEIISAYRKRVKDRLNIERLRQRTARGLPPRKPARITAVTSRADLPSPTATNDENGRTAGFSKGGGMTTEINDGASNGGGIGCGGGCLLQDELGQEPYVMLIRAKNRSTSRTCMSVPFCSEYFGGCKGTCSPDVVGSRSRSISMGAVADGCGGQATAWRADCQAGAPWRAQDNYTTLLGQH